MPRNIVFAIDVEPDLVRPGSNESWEGTAVTLRELSGLRDRIQQRTGTAVRFNWFARFDRRMERAWGPDWVPQAWLLNTAHSSGDLIGVQIHLRKWQEDKGGWYSDSNNPGWRLECAMSAIEGYRALLGERPTASRFEDRRLSEQDIEALKGAGIHYDLSLEPQRCHLEAPKRPYRPAPGNYLMARQDTSNIPAEQDFWLVPLTAAKRAQWIRVNGLPFLARTRPALDAARHPRYAWEQLADEMERLSPQPVVVRLRSGDPADPIKLANIRLLLQNLAESPRMVNGHLVGVDQAVAEFAGDCENHASNWDGNPGRMPSST